MVQRLGQKIFRSAASRALRLGLDRNIAVKNHDRQIILQRIAALSCSSDGKPVHMRHGSGPAYEIRFPPPEKRQLPAAVVVQPHFPTRPAPLSVPQGTLSGFVVYDRDFRFSDEHLMIIYAPVSPFSLSSR